MKISILSPKSDFTPAQQKVLSKTGEVKYLNPPLEHPLEEIKKFANGAEILAIDPDNFGGFETAKERVTKLLETLPTVKYLALDTTSFGWVDLDYCKKRKITVTNVPGYSRESVAEHTITLLLCLAKKVLISDRRTQKGQYKLEMGMELKGKTLGIIGLGNIGSRTAELAQGFGMKVIAFNRSSKKQKNVTMVPLDKLLKASDAIILHVTHEVKNKYLIEGKALKKIKDGVLIVNTVDREIVNEKAMADAISSGKVAGYAYEAGDLEHTPLAKLENAIGLKGFGWYTKESIANLYQIWVNNIIAMAKGKPKNIVE